MPLPFGHAPDWRRVCPVLNADGCLFRAFHAKDRGVMGGPSRCRDFQKPNVVKGVLVWIKVRIFPIGTEDRPADFAGPGRFCFVDGVADVLFVGTIDNLSASTGKLVHLFSIVLPLAS